MAMASVELSGLAFLCFADGDQGFQGILVTNHGQQFTIIGKAGAHPEGHFHECCLEEDSRFYDITVIDHSRVAFADPVVLRHVVRRGGESCSLESDHMEFRTDQLIADKKAEEYIQKYFTAQKVDADSYVCIGNMTMTIAGGGGS